jgi:GNAT superfamily N-acetyltransferase
MPGACDIRVLTREDAGFYPLMGPYFGSRNVFRDLGEQPWDDPGKTWWAALEAGVLTGFAASLDTGTHLVWCSAWIRPDRRGHGLWALLAAERDEASDGREVRVLCRPALEGACARMGFTVTGRTAAYVRMRRLP